MALAGQAIRPAGAAAFSAAAARSCAFFFGKAFLGLLCGARFKTPRPSSSRATRSVGCAPLAIQAFAFSWSSTTRPSASFAFSGSKVPRRSMNLPSRGIREFGDHDPVERPLLGAAARQTNFQWHGLLPFNCWIGD